jgi:hypothetical protein
VVLIVSVIRGARRFRLHVSEMISGKFLLGSAKMFKKLVDFARRQSVVTRIVAFFGALGVIASAILTTVQLIQSFSHPENKEPFTIADNVTETGERRSIQRDEGSNGNYNRNTWINQESVTPIYQQNIVTQGSQSSFGNHNNNTWNNSSRDSRDVNNR